MPMLSQPTMLANALRRNPGMIHLMYSDTPHQRAVCFAEKGQVVDDRLSDFTFEAMETGIFYRCPVESVRDGQKTQDVTWLYLCGSDTIANVLDHDRATVPSFDVDHAGTVAGFWSALLQPRRNKAS